jgi:site-specific recombinase XerD
VKRVTVNKNVIALRASLKWGVENGYFTSNPLQNMKLPKTTDSESNVRYLTDAERTRLFAENMLLRCSRKWVTAMGNKFSYHVTKYFAEYLPLHIGASKNTCKSYRDTFVQLLGFIEDTHHIATGKIELGTITANDVERFLLYLEESKGAGISTRNQRLAAIHSFFRYLQKKELPYFGQCSEILAVPLKKKPPVVMSYLSIEEVKVLFSVPDTKNKKGLRDLAILAILYETGARVQELIDLTPAHLNIEGETPYVELRGKGNKVRRIPIAAEVATILSRYMDVFHICPGHGALFTNTNYY